MHASVFFAISSMRDDISLRGGWPGLKRLAAANRERKVTLYEMAQKR